MAGWSSWDTAQYSYSIQYGSIGNQWWTVKLIQQTHHRQIQRNRQHRAQHHHQWNQYQSNDNTFKNSSTLVNNNCSIRQTIGWRSLVVTTAATTRLDCGYNRGWYTYVRTLDQKQHSTVVVLPTMSQTARDDWLIHSIDNGDDVYLWQSSRLCHRLAKQHNSSLDANKTTWLSFKKMLKSERVGNGHDSLQMTTTARIYKRRIVLLAAELDRDVCVCGSNGQVSTVHNQRRERRSGR